MKSYVWYIVVMGNDSFDGSKRKMQEGVWKRIQRTRFM